MVVVGHRSSAVEVACRDYARVVQVANAAAKRIKASNLSRISLPQDNDHAIAPIADAVRQQVRPVAVAALTEATVVPAARLREALGLHGLPVTTARACTEKALMKRTVSAAGVAVAPFVTAGECQHRDALVERLGLPLVIKREYGSGGREMRVVHDVTEMPGIVDAGWMAEAFIDGVEMSVESFVACGEPLFVNFTQYREPRWANIVPADATKLPVDELLRMNRRVIEVLGIERGMTHMEVFLTRNGLVFGEIAARPPGGRIMELLELAYGFDPWRAFFAVESGERPALPQRPKQVAGMRIVHPGPGTVLSVAGDGDVRSQPGFVDLHCTVRPGKRLGAREGAGQSAGHAVFAGDRAVVEAGLDFFRENYAIAVREADKSSQAG